MDHEAFDRIARVLGAAGSRRAALSALLGGGALGAVGNALSKKKNTHRDNGNHRDKNRAKRKKKQGKKRQSNSPQAQPAPEDIAVAAEATCGNPGPSSNLNNCNFAGDDLDGFDLSGSNMKNTTFNGASLCGAKLHDSTLTNADFRNANLTKADLHSSGCNGVKTNAATRFCNTIMCNGNVNNSDCPSGVNACCEVDDCEDRACFTRSCGVNSVCQYSIQANGAPGNLCPDPRVCCNGNCCAVGQKCCGTTCIATDQCCSNGTPGCPSGQTCLNGQTCCPDGRVCGGACLPQDCPGPSRCLACNPEAGTCDNICGTNEDCCVFDCKVALGQPCTDRSECCLPDITSCAGEPKRCCHTEGMGCGNDSHCCQGLVCDDGECEEP